MTAFGNILTALGWSLLNSIWQMALLWIIYYLLTADNKKLSAAGKHNLALVFVFIGTEWFIYTFIRLLKEPSAQLSQGFIPLPVSVENYMPFLGIAYLFILVTRILHSGYWHYHRQINRSGDSISPLLQSFADRQVRLLGIPKRVQVFLSAHVTTAETSGFMKPLILLPVSLVTRLTTRQLETILVHELFHIRRNDYLMNICMACFRNIFFFNPFARLFYSAVAKERELACDDGVMELGYEPALYAEALYSLEKHRQVNEGFSLAADGNKPWLLMERIRRLLGKPTSGTKHFNTRILIQGMAALILFGIQQKKPEAEKTGEAVFNQAAYKTILYKPSDKKTMAVEKILLVKAAVRPVNSKMKILNPVNPKPALSMVQKPAAAPAAYFATSLIDRNFSNEQAVATNRDPVLSFPGTPYVPSASLTYEALPEVMAADSIHYTDMLNGLNELAASAKMKTIVQLKLISQEIEKNLKDLRETEIKNREMILLDPHPIRPMIEKLQKQMQGKKKEIDRLQSELQKNEEEIIHI